MVLEDILPVFLFPFAAFLNFMPNYIPKTWFSQARRFLQPHWKGWLLAQVTLHRGTCGFEISPFFAPIMLPR